MQSWQMLIFVKLLATQHVSYAVNRHLVDGKRYLGAPPMLSRLPIMRQFTLLGVLGVILTLFALGLGLKTSYELALQAKESQLKTLVDASVTMAQHFAALADEGKMTTAQAQQAALTAIGGARFDNGNYIFVYDYTGLTLMHADKSFIGTNRYNVQDPYGTVIAGPMIEAAKAGTPIFHEYYVPKANQSTPQPKLAYCAAVPEWGWVIGTGLYIDDLQTLLIHRLIGLALLFFPLFAGFLILLVMLRRAASQLLRGISSSMSEIAKGALETPIPSLTRQDEIGIMARRVAEFRDTALQKREL
jgi:methyl-accepting chemotaxis protein